MTNSEELILLNLAPGVTAAQWRRLFAAFEGNIKKIGSANLKELQAAGGLGEAVAQRIVRESAAHGRIRAR